MRLRLVRYSYTLAGVFGRLLDDAGRVICDTLEHSYELEPKLPAGFYDCQRGHHELHSGPIETFEVIGVPGHTGILFHCGNTEDDSEGCVLVGLAVEGSRLIQSRLAFKRLMKHLEGLSSFELEVCSHIE